MDNDLIRMSHRVYWFLCAGDAAEEAQGPGQGVGWTAAEAKEPELEEHGKSNEEPPLFQQPTILDRPTAAVAVTAGDCRPRNATLVIAIRRHTTRACTDRMH